jgi:hypothetical protein
MAEAVRAAYAMSETVRARIESYDKAYKVQNMNYIESEN